MHYSVGQESVNLEMETKARSLQVAIYFKLESSKSAADEVLKLLTTVCKNSGVEVIPYKDYQKGSNNLLLSVVVVIDARQTNIADEQKPITPYEDHVEELAKLEKETSPTVIDKLWRLSTSTDIKYLKLENTNLVA
ncbi:uncharacterized protein [Ptychodera flava]|uniref:uncharacterized protein n=1 Tax=Ptychodera flava TaxID=63121 RepID=UPI00396AAEE3